MPLEMRNYEVFDVRTFFPNVFLKVNILNEFSFLAEINYNYWSGVSKIHCKVFKEN